MNSWVLQQLQPAKHDNYPLVRERWTTESKKLRVFGVLFNVRDEHVLFLRAKYLGIVPAISRGRNPIVVLGRGRIQ